MGFLDEIVGIGKALMGEESVEVADAAPSPAKAIDPEQAQALGQAAKEVMAAKVERLVGILPAEHKAMARTMLLSLAEDAYSQGMKDATALLS